MADPWDGTTERREVVLLSEQLQPPGKSVEVPLAAVIVGFASLALFQLAALVSLIIVASDVRDANGQAQEFREQLSCFVVRTSQGRPPPDVLDDCGFLVVAGGK